MSKRRGNAETYIKGEISSRGITVPAKVHQAELSGHVEIRIKGEIAKGAAFIEDNTAETSHAQGHKEAAEKGGIVIAGDIMVEVEGGISRRSIVTKGQMVIEEERTVKDEGQLAGTTLYFEVITAESKAEPT